MSKTPPSSVYCALLLGDWRKVKLLIMHTCWHSFVSVKSRGNRVRKISISINMTVEIQIEVLVSGMSHILMHVILIKSAGALIYFSVLLLFKCLVTWTVKWHNKKPAVREVSNVMLVWLHLKLCTVSIYQWKSSFIARHRVTYGNKKSVNIILLISLAFSIFFEKLFLKFKYGFLLMKDVHFGCLFWTHLFNIHLDFWFLIHIHTIALSKRYKYDSQLLLWRQIRRLCT